MKIHSAIKTDGVEGFSKTLKETSGSQPLGLYIHVPFCAKKCPYCHFFVVPDTQTDQQHYHTALLKELSLYRETLGNFPIRSLYFGGGTPSRYDALAEFLEELAPPPGIEITIEANPEDITLEKMESFRHLGINRVSIGVQSFSEDELVTLGRLHSKHRAIDAIWETHAAGISNISIDLMFELPGQTIDRFEETLFVTSHLPITHLSLYNLTFEEQTVFHKKRKELLPLVAPDAEKQLMLDRAVAALEEMGLSRYEISAFAKPGFEAQHNLGYWKAAPFLGLGPSAFSYVEGARFRNVPNLRTYAQRLREGDIPIDFYEKLPEEDALAERLAIHLRVFQGVHLNTFPPLPLPLQKRINTLECDGLLALEGTRLHLTEKGKLFYDTVGASLI